MKRLLVGFVLVAAVGACRTRRVSISADGAAAATSVSSVLPRSEPPNAPHTQKGLVMSTASYSAKFASHTRNSRVTVNASSFAALRRVVPLPHAPRFVLTNDAGDHLVLDYGDRYEVRTRGGALMAHDRKMIETSPFVWSASFIVDDREKDFSGDARPALLTVSAGPNDTGWASEIGELTATYIVQKHAFEYSTTEPVPGTNEVARVWNRSPTELFVASVRFHDRNRAGDTLVWTKTFEGGGCGAVGNDRFIAVATADRRFFAYDANATGPGGSPPPPLASAPLSFVPYDISIVEGGVAVLSGGNGSSTVHMLARDGRERWQATVPFRVDAPPIDAGGGRVYLVGDGFAAADNGNVLWSQKSTAHTYATSLADGSALLAIGSELRHVSRDGAILRQVRVPEGDALVAPPAVAADGTVWLASGKALYVVR